MFQIGESSKLQVIAREDKGPLGIDYNRSPTVYITLKPQKTRSVMKSITPVTKRNEIHYGEVTTIKSAPAESGESKDQYFWQNATAVDVENHRLLQNLRQMLQEIKQLLQRNFHEKKLSERP